QRSPRGGRFRGGPGLFVDVPGRPGRPGRTAKGAAAASGSDPTPPTPGCRRARLAGLSRCPLAVAARGPRLELEPDRREAQQWTIIGDVDIHVERHRTAALATPRGG